MPQRRRALLDENIDVRLAREFRTHGVSTVGREGWSGVKNGQLLLLIERAEFEVFITADRNLQYQQTLAGRPFGTLVLYPKLLKLSHLLPLVPSIEQAIGSVNPGEVLHIHPPA